MWLFSLPWDSLPPSSRSCSLLHVVKICRSGFQASSAEVMICIRFENVWWAFLIKSSCHLLNVDALTSTCRQQFLKLSVSWLPNIGSTHAVFTGTLWDSGVFKICLLTNTRESGYLKVPNCSPKSTNRWFSFEPSTFSLLYQTTKLEVFISPSEQKPCDQEAEYLRVASLKDNTQIICSQ